MRVIGGDTLLDLRAEPGPRGRRRRATAASPTCASSATAPPRSTPARRRCRSTAPATPTVSGSGATGGSVGDEPDWQTIGHDGRLVWHDHRIHAQDTAEFTGDVAWSVPITVDGVAVTIDGRLERVDPPSPLPFLGLAVVVAGATWFLGSAPRPARGRGRRSLIASVLAATTGAIEWLSLPGSVARNAGLFLLPVGRRRWPPSSGWRSAGARPRWSPCSLSVSLLSGWLAFRWSILTRSVLVSDLAPTVDRIALAVVLGAVVAAAGLTVQWAGHPRDPRAGRRTSVQVGTVRAHLLDLGHRLAQLGDPVALVPAHQADAPGQRLAAAAGHAGVDQGVEHGPLVEAQAGHGRRRSGT